MMVMFVFTMMVMIMFTMMIMVARAVVVTMMVVFAMMAHILENYNILYIFYYTYYKNIIN
uniref:Uncharacterized protein n=1 Tax=viral metagenome TaxID=1070528 RepID=A0A6C0E4Z1_9ZZZZ